MRHYRRNYSGSDRIKKIMFRILFVLIAAAVITFGSIILGNYLAKKVSSLEAEQNADADRINSADSQIYKPVRGRDYESPDVFGTSLVLSECSGEDEAVLIVNTISQYYDTILLHITDKSGKLTYTSPALCDLNNMPSPEENPEFRLFVSAATAIKAQNKRLSVLIVPSFTINDPQLASLSVGTLITELASYGADEILIKYPDEVPLTSASAQFIHDYIVSCRSLSRDICPIGVLLSYTHYLENDKIMEVEKIADAASYLAIGFTAEENASPGATYRKVSASLTSLLGSFNVYNMRILLQGSNNLLAESYQACRDADMSNVCFMSSVIPDDLVYFIQSNETESPEKTQPTDPSANTNPYSEVKKPEQETESPESDYQPGTTPWY